MSDMDDVLYRIQRKKNWDKAVFDEDEWEREYREKAEKLNQNKGE